MARLGLLAAVPLLVFVPAASAGRLIESGHDFDFHCARDGAPDECNMVRVAVNWARSGAPSRSRPVLVLDRLVGGDAGQTDVQAAINRAFGAGRVPMTVVNP